MLDISFVLHTVIGFAQVAGHRQPCITLNCSDDIGPFAVHEASAPQCLFSLLMTINCIWIFADIMKCQLTKGVQWVVQFVKISLLVSRISYLLRYSGIVSLFTAFIFFLSDVANSLYFSFHGCPCWRLVILLTISQSRVHGHFVCTTLQARVILNTTVSSSHYAVLLPWQPEIHL